MSYVTDNWDREYYDGASLDIPCDHKGCAAESVRLKCNAEGFPMKTHPHGGIHRLGKGLQVFHYCLEHGTKYLRLNESVLARRAGK